MTSLPREKAVNEIKSQGIMTLRSLKTSLIRQASIFVGKVLLIF